LALDLPRRIFFQQSTDLGKTWQQLVIPPEPRRPIDDYVGDFGDCISRVRRLHDGQLIATGVIRPDPKRRELGEALVMLSADEGKTWTPQMLALPAEAKGLAVWNEWDSAELNSGGLFCVFRRRDSND